MSAPSSGVNSGASLEPEVGRHSAGKNVAAMVGGDIASRALILIAFAFAARTAGPAIFGQLNLAIGLLAFLSLVVDPGLQYVAQRAFVAANPQRDQLLGQVVGLRLFLALVVLVGIGAVSVFSTNRLW